MFLRMIMSFPWEKMRKDRRNSMCKDTEAIDRICASGRRGEMGEDPKEVSWLQIMEGFCLHANEFYLVVPSKPICALVIFLCPSDFLRDYMTFPQRRDIAAKILHMIYLSHQAMGLQALDRRKSFNEKEDSGLCGHKG